VTLDLEADSPVLGLPWIITFGPLNDNEEWEPVVCGPYERPHAMALAELVVADEELMAVVEPLQPHVSAEQIRHEIVVARLTAEKEAAAAFDAGLGDMLSGRSGGGNGGPDGEDLRDTHAKPAPPLSPTEVRQGFARIAARLTG
jgi:hypothetical protein